MPYSNQSHHGPRVFISAAEPSADLHGATLIRTVRAKRPDVHFYGIAGPLMREAGCHGVDDLTGEAGMAGGIIRMVPRAIGLLRRTRKFVTTLPTDLAVVIDSPLLHLPMAKYAQEAGIPVLYFIAPQVWAWGEYRVERIKKRIDRLAVILPFEEAYFRGHGMDAEYVGHPLFDVLENRQLDQGLMAELKSKGQPTIAILPGSRRHVVEEVLPGQLEIAEAIRKVHPQAHFGISIASDRTEDAVQRLLATHPDLPITPIRGHNGELLSAATLTLIASGTSTLEAAYYHSPMVIMYNATRAGYYFFGKWVITTPYLSLVNILANKQLVPEFMPFYRSTEPIKKVALDLLASPRKLDQMRKDISAMIDPLVKTGAAENAASVLLGMLEEHGKGAAAGSTPAAT